MNEIEVQRQIDQMVKFIKQEAEEKAKEIQVSSDEEFNREKLQLLEKEKGKIRKDYERREAQVEVKKKIDYSKNLNDMRLKVLAAREAAIQEIVHEARNKLKEVSKNPQTYKKLLTDLLTQGMHKLGEKAAIVRCRQVDLMAVKEVVDAARKNYTALFGEEAPTLTVDSSDFLPPPPTEGADSELESCCGGVVLTSTDRRISCSNTLDDRIKIAYQANLPDIRTVLFGAFVAAR
jgi:V-type H+-transporting ATPase subunit E